MLDTKRCAGPAGSPAGVTARCAQACRPVCSCSWRPLRAICGHPALPAGPTDGPGHLEKRGRRWLDVLEACQLLGACCVGIRRGHQSGRSAPTLNTLSCSVTSTEPACAMALQETAARRFCDCQHVRRPPRLAVMLGLRHGGRELLRGLQGRSRVGPCNQLHHANLLLKRPSWLRSSSQVGTAGGAEGVIRPRSEHCVG